MTGESIHIRNDQGFHLLPGGSTYAPSFADAGAGHWSLEWSEHQFILLYEVESYPKPSELFLEGSYNIGEIGNKIRFAQN